MKCLSSCLLTLVPAVVVAGTVRAESAAEYANPPPGSGSPWALAGPVQPAKPRAQPAVRPATFAPGAAASARHMTAQQREERRFLKDAAASSRFAAEASRMALGKSSNPGVRSFAATLINHHATAGNELLHLLHGRGMAAPMLANDQRRTLNRMAKLRGSKFDREFMREVALKYQQDDIQSYEKASHVVGEPRLKAWIDRSLPTMRYNLATAQRLAPADVKLARGSPQSGAANQFVSRTSTGTQSMGAAPAADGMQFGGMPFGGSAPLGVARPAAIRPNESSTR